MMKSLLFVCLLFPSLLFCLELTSKDKAKMGFSIDCSKEHDPKKELLKYQYCTPRFKGTRASAKAMKEMFYTVWEFCNEKEKKTLLENQKQWFMWLKKTAPGGSEIHRENSFRKGELKSKLPIRYMYNKDFQTRVIDKKPTKNDGFIPVNPYLIYLLFNEHIHEVFIGEREKGKVYTRKDGFVQKVKDGFMVGGKLKKTTDGYYKNDEGFYVFKPATSQKEFGYRVKEYLGCGEYILELNEKFKYIDRYEKLDVQFFQKDTKISLGSNFISNKLLLRKKAGRDFKHTWVFEKQRKQRKEECKRRGE